MSAEPNSECLGELAVERGFVTVGQLSQAIREHEKRLASGADISLGEVLIEMGFLAPAQLEAIVPALPAEAEDAAPVPPQPEPESVPEPKQPAAKTAEGEDEAKPKKKRKRRSTKKQPVAKKKPTRKRKSTRKSRATAKAEAAAAEAQAKKLGCIQVPLFICAAGSWLTGTILLTTQMKDPALVAMGGLAFLVGLIAGCAAKICMTLQEEAGRARGCSFALLIIMDIVSAGYVSSLFVGAAFVMRFKDSMEKMILPILLVPIGGMVVLKLIRWLVEGSRDDD